MLLFSGFCPLVSDDTGLILLFLFSLFNTHTSQVDAVSSESTADVRRWRRAQIVEESSTGRLRLSFETLSDYHDEWVSRDSANIAPPG